MLPTQAARRHHVWTCDFIFDGTDNGGSVKMMTLLDEYSHQSLAIQVERQITVSLLPPCCRQRLRTTCLIRRIQRPDRRTVSLFVRMVVTLGHRDRLLAGEVVDLLDGDAEIR